VESNGSTVCMIGGAGNLPSKMARTKSRPAIDATTSGGVTPYSMLGAAWSCMGLVPVYDDDRHTKCHAVAPAFSGYGVSESTAVILRCALLRAWARVRTSHPSRLAEVARTSG
jgi:hypothetical protein